ncbi:MAG: TIGR04283 family arsenosugar biosynthesis glycosyltransferase [Proteobacteria bacterium]|nr:TIGR04283 family arsenosugar biosynthesis glycosyltransferase [Pseudomonadota bacterium]
MNVKLSVVIPTLNESDQIEQGLNKLQSLRHQGHEVIVVDGGSNDNTVSLASPLCDRVIQSERSRSIQMNAGSAAASGQCILYLHADTDLPEDVADIFSKIINIENVWGRFDIQLSGQSWMFRIIETCMNTRSRITGIATGDQVIFVGKELFSKVNGFPEIALMEDVAISKLLINFSKPICFTEKVVSSNRRWKENGIIKTIIKMWIIRLLYYFQFDTERLAKLYQ